MALRLALSQRVAFIGEGFCGLIELNNNRFELLTG
jgi:hypothetical protein